MSRRRRHHGSGNAGLRSARRQIALAMAAVAEQPAQATALGLVAAGMLWLIATNTLPHALAVRNPDLALAINPSHPVAMIAKAERLRKELLTLTSTEEPVATEAADPRQRRQNEVGDTMQQLPQAAERPDAEVVRTESEALRTKIRDLAERIIAAAPLDSRGFRLLGEVTDNVDRARELMKAALARSRREGVAAFWLLNDAVTRGEYATSVELMDILLRTQPQLTQYVAGYMIQASEDKEAREKIVALLATGPQWREAFFRTMPQTLTKVEPPVALVMDLAQSNAPATAEELGPFFTLLVRHGYAEVAYGVWYQLLPKKEQEAVGLIRNGSFETDPAGIPFDWNILGGENVVAEILPLNETSGPRGLHVNFGQGRVKFPQVTQLVMLAPGKYRLEGKLRGTIVAKRGLRWQVRCITESKLLAETEMLLGATATWRQFSLDIEVPELDCTGQVVSLMHDARSPAEQLIEGDVWFDDLTLTRSLY